LFPSQSAGLDGGGFALCAAPGLTPCTSDSDCSGSGLVCGVLYGNFPTGVASANACVNGC
jgi:hypothetical protein